MKHATHHLTVIQDFGSYRKGDHIEEYAEVERILGSELHVHVNKVKADVDPAPQALPAVRRQGDDD